MIWAILGFAFAALGSKVLLGLAMVYVFLPSDRACARCDAETGRLEAPRALRALAERLGIQWRWCPRCGETYLARGTRPPRLWVGKGERRPRAPVPEADLQRFAR